MALPLILSSFCIAYTFLPLCLPCLFFAFTFALTFIKITINFALNTSVLSFVVGVKVSKALNLNIGALLKANNSLFKTSDYRVGSLNVTR